MPLTVMDITNFGSDLAVTNFGSDLAQHCGCTLTSIAHSNLQIQLSQEPLV